MNGIIKSPKTTIGAFVILAATAALLLKQIDVTTAITLIGLGGTFAGLSAKDSDKTGKQ